MGAYDTAGRPPGDLLGGVGASPVVIAHRGDPLAATENTLAAFAAAAVGGADMIELDLRRAADGTVMVLHDETLSRLWALDRPAAELVPAELARLGRGDEYIPTLAEVLARVELPLMVDFTGAEVVDGAVAEVRAAGAMGRSLFVSGNVGALARLRDLAPEAHIGLTWIEPALPGDDLLRRLGAECWNPAYQLVTPTRVAAFCDRGLRVSTWTVDDRHQMARVVEAGVDAVVTNRLADLRRFLAGDGPSAP